VGKIFDALKKKADPIAEQVLNPAAIASSEAASAAPASSAALDSALAAVLAGDSPEMKKAPAESAAEQVPNPSAIASPEAASPAPAGGAALDSALAAVLAGPSAESKEMPAGSPAGPFQASADGEAEAAHSAPAELPPFAGPGLGSRADGIVLEASQPAGSPAPQGAFDGSTSNFRAEVMPEAAPAVNGRALLAPIRILDAKTLPICVPGGDPLLPFDSSPSRASEQYRYLRTKLVQNPKQPRLILISSPGPGDGKTVTAVNLTGALSLKSSAAVALVDADLRRASLHRHLGVPKSPGLTDVLRGTCALEEVLIHAEQFPNLFLIPAGESKENPAELLDSNAWPAIAERLRATFQYVVIDSPPVASVADYHLIEASCDGVVLVVRPDHTRRTLTMQALETVPREKALGIVLNCTKDWFLRKYSHYDYAYEYLALEGSAKDQKR